MAIRAVMIDSREPKWIRELKFGGVPTMVATLDCCDLHIVCDDNEILVIERKTPEDFLGSLKDGRLFAQVAKMREKSRWCYVLITGQFECGRDENVITESRVTGWDWAAVQGALLSIQETGVFVQHCAGDSDFEQAVMRLANRSRSEIMWLPPARDPKIINGSLGVLTAFPNIGIETAQKILEHCGSVAWALVEITDGGKVPGVGDVTRNLVRRTLGLHKDDELIIQAKEQNEQSN
jgi:ERCC4-type nuclease